MGGAAVCFTEFVLNFRKRGFCLHHVTSSFLHLPTWILAWKASRWPRPSHLKSPDHLHAGASPSEQPLVDGGQLQQLEQQPDGEREEDEGEGLDEQVEAHVQKRRGQLLQRERRTQTAAHFSQARLNAPKGRGGGCYWPPSSGTGRCWRRWWRRRCRRWWPLASMDLTEAGVTLLWQRFLKVPVQPYFIYGQSVPSDLFTKIMTFSAK